MRRSRRRAKKPSALQIIVTLILVTDRLEAACAAAQAGIATLREQQAGANLDVAKLLERRVVRTVRVQIGWLERLIARLRGEQAPL